MPPRPCSPAWRPALTSAGVRVPADGSPCGGTRRWDAADGRAPAGACHPVRARPPNGSVPPGRGSRTHLVRTAADGSAAPPGRRAARPQGRQADRPGCPDRFEPGPAQPPGRGRSARATPQPAAARPARAIGRDHSPAPVGANATDRTSPDAARAASTCAGRARSRCGPRTSTSSR